MTGDPVASLFGATKDVTYQTRLSSRSSGDLLWWLFCLVSRRLVSVTVRPQHLSLCLSQWEAGPRVLYPLAGKSLVITSTSGHFYGPLIQPADHNFICVVKFHTLSLLLFISEILTRYFKLIWLLITIMCCVSVYLMKYTICCINKQVI